MLFYLGANNEVKWKQEQNSIEINSGTGGGVVNRVITDNKISVYCIFNRIGIRKIVGFR